MGITELRDAWLDSVAARIGASLAKRGIEPAPDLAELGGAGLTKAALICSAAAAHSGGEFLGAIGDRMAKGRWTDERADPLEAAHWAVSAYRTRGFAVPEWWDAVCLQLSLLESWAERALRSASAERVEELLLSRWLVPEETAATLATGIDPPRCTQTKALLDSAGDSTIGRLGSTQVGQDVESESRQSLEKPFDTHPLLPDLAGAIGMAKTFRSVRHHLREEGVPEEDLGDLEAGVESLIVAIEEDMRCLSRFEQLALHPLDDGERALREAAEATKKRIYIASLGEIGLMVANGLSERVEGRTLAADDLVDLVFSAGARSGIEPRGPAAYIWLALEKHELPADGDISVLAIRVPDEEELPFELTLGIGSDTDGPSMSYRVGHTDATRRWLAMAVLSGRLTIDIFEVDPKGGLSLLTRVCRPDAELTAKLRGPTIKSLRENELEPFLAGVNEVDQVIAGFGLCENAKSELLLEIAADVENPDDEVRSARGRLLDAQISRADKLYAGADPTKAEGAVEEARRAYVNTRSEGSRRAAKRMGEDPLGAHRELVAGFATERRAVVHYSLKDGRIQGFWSADGGESRGWIAGEGVDVGALADAARPWLENEHGDVDALLEAARPVGEELHESLPAAELDELVVCPWAVLNGVPFTALPLAGGTLGEHLRISYAPSLGLLRPALEDAPAREGVELVSAHDGSLPWAEVEVAAARSIYSEARVTPDRAERGAVIEAMQRGRIVHLASHGRWWRDDPFASALDLNLGDPIERHVSAAEVHRDIDLRGAELVLLSACDTGRSPAVGQGIETYSGIDAAFLAKGARSVVSALWPVHDLAAALFMTVLHVELARGEVLPAAFGRSVEFLRKGEVSGLAPEDPVSVALDASGREWRAAAESRAAYFQTARIWAAFKLSGVPWLSRPLAGTARPSSSRPPTRTPDERKEPRGGPIQPSKTSC